MKEELRVTVGKRVGDVSALLALPRGARSALVLAHGAGAGMRHPFMEAVCSRLGERAIATFRYQFPYMEAGRKRPNPPGVLVATVRAAVAAARAAIPDLPLLAGGKSMGGRMTSQAASGGNLSAASGLVFYGFPLHPAGRLATERAEHLEGVDLPMLFLQGTRDALADLDLLRPVCEGLGERARLHVIDGADHSFHVPKRSGRTDGDVLDELARVTAGWAAEVLPAHRES